MGTTQIMEVIKSSKSFSDKIRQLSALVKSQSIGDPCDPADYRPSLLLPALLPGFLRCMSPAARGKQEVLKRCFIPSVSAVITISVPQMLLSASLFALLTGFGIYLGFIWTRNLDTNASGNDSRNVMVVYVVALAVCLGSIRYHELSRMSVSAPRKQL